MEVILDKGKVSFLPLGKGEEEGFKEEISNLNKKGVNV
jgi:hypothetical protein